MNMIANTLDRSRYLLRRLFPDGYGSNTKHSFEKDYGWPETLDFGQFYRLYCRSSIAMAAVEKTVGKTWETHPELWESESPSDTPSEQAIAKHFLKRNIWRGMMDADRRSMVGSYAGAIIILRDGKPLSEPVERVGGGIDAVAAIIPAWEGQLQVSEWDADPMSERYGQPVAYQFDEQAVGNTSNGAFTSVRIHPDRVLIFSDDGTLNCRSALEAGFNDVTDAEKVKGAGGEGFWKSSRAMLIVEAPNGASPQDIARNMGAASSAEARDKVHHQVAEMQQGFDPALVIGGFSAKVLNVSLPQPKEFWEIPAMSFAASMNIPFKVLIGNVTGERASTEDAAEWAQTNMSRRANRVVPILNEFIERLVRWGVLPARDWVIGWDSLLDASDSEKLDRAAIMSTINAQSSANGELVFLPDEIRETAGFAPSDDIEDFIDVAQERRDEMHLEAEDGPTVEIEE